MDRNYIKTRKIDCGIARNLKLKTGKRSVKNTHLFGSDVRERKRFSFRNSRGSDVHEERG